ncbi:HAD family hydrolase [Perlabentimonas gracilis]|uniref:HAD family hydrolase n=1 Tax=Perlabentimonas gracilis TaxID=2715279 RepID=UPI00140CD84B|nr:HAD family phosphatase [Perlabentimonas gracilis]NHB68950.1 HAD family phosphatase [Perlabentimonas gracilis]
MSKPIFIPFANQNIKNIIFDLGGVILNIDYHLTIDAYKNLGITDFDSMFTQAQQVGLFDQLDKGLVTPAQFRDGIRQISNPALTDKQIDDAWNAMLLDFPPQRLDVLEKVKPHYSTFLLSNTNAIHIEEYNKVLHKTFGVDNLSVYFDKEYYSHLIHMRKPDAEAFEIILRENNLNPSETLFIDDTQQHVEGARKLGILAHHLNIPAGECIEKLFT